MITWFQNRLKNHPNSSFIIFQNKSYSISNISGNILSIQKVFSASGIKPKDRLIILLPNGIEIIETILACFEMGVIAVPISTKFTDIELIKIIKMINPVSIITNWELSSRVNNLGVSILEVEEFPSIARICQVYKPINNIKKTDVAAIILTSGTTDIPKAVQLTYENFEASCRNWDSFLTFNCEDQFLCCLPLHHIGGLAVIVRGLIYGFCINLAESFSANLIYELIKKYPISIVSLVPTMLEKIVNKKDGINCLLPLKAILLGGGPASDKLLDISFQNQLNLVKTYGMTETCSGIVGLWIKNNPGKKQFSGIPFPEVQLKIKNEEVYIKGPMVMKGYLNEADNVGFYNSQDIGWLDKNNNLFIKMRRKDLIVTGGENVNPKEIETVLLKINKVNDCVIIGVSDQEWGQRIIAYLSTIDNNKIDKKELINKLSKELSKYKLPKEFIFVEFISRNEIGKVKLEDLKYL